MMFVGNKVSYNPGLEPLDTIAYACPFCGAEKDVPGEYDVLQGYWFPVNTEATKCFKCGEFADKK